MQHGSKHTYINTTVSQESQDLDAVFIMGISEEDPYTKLSTRSKDVNPYNEVAVEMTNEYVYDVEVCDTEASERCSLHGHYKIVLTDTTLRLVDGSCLAYSWPLNTIRRFGVDPYNIFFMEAGRRAPSGEGMFRFKANDPRDIHDRALDRCKQIVIKYSSPGRLQNKSVEDQE
ncbi:hypothetical protein CHS0354_003871 [Potamilus streckersoni]|uniref:IRS-type PTB domain-containing protein n=1 Tax=Potamilus streckersoni TaxID=2493646 RepID=A0AAE0TKK0_9BIVA|nr:hypothetical protein CHS0354_003871 [Potamilus streckersoni]